MIPAIEREHLDYSAAYCVYAEADCSGRSSSRYYADPDYVIANESADSFFDGNQLYVSSVTDISTLLANRPSIWHVVNTRERELFEERKAVRRYIRTSGGSFGEFLAPKGTCVFVRGNPNIWLKITPEVENHTVNAHEDSASSVLETLAGTLNSIEGDTAYVTLVGDDGKSFIGSYPSEQFLNEDILEGESFTLSVIDLGTDVKFKIKRTEPVIVPEDEQRAQWSNLDALFGDDSLWASDD